MATTWSTTDRQQNTLSNGNLTATATAGGFSSGRTNVSWSAGKIYLEMLLGSAPPSGPNPFSAEFSGEFGAGGSNPFSAEFSAEFGSGAALTPISNSMLVGIANSSWNLFNQLGQSVPSSSVGVAVGNLDEVYVNGTFFSGGVHPCAVGDTVSMAVDYGISRFWYSTDQMQIDIGAGAWNNSLTDNPATGSGGLDFSSQTGPFFGAWFSDTVGNVVTINAHSSWHRAIPSGFSAADSNTLTGVIFEIHSAETGVLAGQVVVGGIISVTQAPQTMSGAGTATLPARSGVISASQDPQTMSGAGIVSAGASHFGPIVATQGVETMVATGTVTTVSLIGVISVIEAPDTVVASGFVGIQVGIPFVEWMS